MAGFLKGGEWETEGGGGLSGGARTQSSSPFTLQGSSTSAHILHPHLAFNSFFFSKSPLSHYDCFKLKDLSLISI